MFWLFQGSLGSVRMAQPNVAQMQNQYMQTGPFQGSNPVLGAGSVDMAHPGNDSTVTQVREHRCSLNCITFLMYNQIEFLYFIKQTYGPSLCHLTF